MLAKNCLCKPCHLSFESACAISFTDRLLNKVRLCCQFSLKAFQKCFFSSCAPQGYHKMLKKIIAPSVRVFRGLSVATTVDGGEVSHFKQYSGEWWNVAGPFKPLHSMNKLRVKLVRDGLIDTRVANPDFVGTPLPLKNLQILDVGCGGGVLTEPLARIGASLTGIDAETETIEVAKNHAHCESLSIRYKCESIEVHCEANPEKYDAVIASEVVEHVTNKEEFLRLCLGCLKPGGSLFLTTMNKTCLANLAGVVLAEYVLKLTPEGTHDFHKFIEPHKLQRILEDQNCKSLLVHGMTYNPFSNRWAWSGNTAINYAMQAVKLKS